MRATGKKSESFRLSLFLRLLCCPAAPASPGARSEPLGTPFYRVLGTTSPERVFLSRVLCGRRKRGEKREEGGGRETKLEKREWSSNQVCEQERKKNSLVFAFSVPLSFQERERPHTPCGSGGLPHAALLCCPPLMLSLLLIGFMQIVVDLLLVIQRFL